MSNVFKKDIFIRASGLAKAETLLLTFKPLENIGFKQQQVAWKVIPFGANTTKKAQAEYMSQLAFIGTEVDSTNLISPSTYRKVDVGDAVEFALDANKNLVVNPTDENKKHGFISARNATGRMQDIAIGLHQPDPKKKPEPVLLFPKVGNNSVVVAKYHPILRAYMTSDYQETEVISSEIKAGMIWERDLAQLDDTTHWRLKHDSSSGRYSLIVDDNV